jgi:hypothetical protein
LKILSKSKVIALSIQTILDGIPKVLKNNTKVGLNPKRELKRALATIAIRYGNQTRKSLFKSSMDLLTIFFAERSIQKKFTRKRHE